MKGAKLPIGAGMDWVVEAEADVPASFPLHPGWGPRKKELAEEEHPSLGRCVGGLGHEKAGKGQSGKCSSSWTMINLLAMDAPRHP